MAKDSQLRDYLEVSSDQVFLSTQLKLVYYLEVSSDQVFLSIQLKTCLEFGG